jgi:putative lipoic acid-binding regulatory protein
MAGHLPSIELLESIHKFPCVFTFKAIGLSTDCFVGRVLFAVKQELNEDAEPSFSSRVTAGGKHTSVTVEPMVASAEQVIAIYHRIHGVDGIVMMM